MEKRILWETTQPDHPWTFELVARSDGLYYFAVASDRGPVEGGQYGNPVRAAAYGVALDTLRRCGPPVGRWIIGGVYERTPVVMVEPSPGAPRVGRLHPTRGRVKVEVELSPLVGGVELGRWEYRVRPHSPGAGGRGYRWGNWGPWTPYPK